jgi:zinc transporter ZupT
MDDPQVLKTGLAVLVFAATFLFGNLFHPLRPVLRDQRSMVSFAGGMAAAYMFVHVMPELHSARGAYATSMARELPFEGMIVYFVSLLGFLVFYAIDHLRRVSRRKAAEEPGEERSFRFHVSGFAVYAFMVSYLLLHNLDQEKVSLVLYALAMAAHFLALSHTLRLEYGAAYDTKGRYILAAASVAGWACALPFSPPLEAIAFMTAFVSGAIIVNSVLMELPAESDGKFLPFLLGGLIYGAILVPLG